VPKVHFQTEMVTVEVPENTTLREVAIQQGIQLYRGMWTHINCIGNGVCGRCMIWILSDGKRVSRPSVRERVHRIKGTQRLACQVKVIGDVVIRTRPIGPAVVSMSTPGSTLRTPSYKEAAEQRYLEAVEEEQKKAELAAKKAKQAAEAQKKAEAEAQSGPIDDAGAEGARAPDEVKPDEAKPDEAAAQ